MDRFGQQVASHSHRFQIQHPTERIICAGSAEGYTHVVIYARGLEFMIERPTSKLAPAA